MNILLVEDDRAAARLIEELFREMGNDSFSLRWVDRLEAGFEVLNKGGIDAVLLDLMLPDSAGLETVHRMVAAYPTVPILVLTTLADVKIGISAVKAGAQDYLFKGEVDGPLLIRSLQYATERKHIHEALAESEARYRTIFESTGTAMAILEKDLHIAMVNREFEGTLRYPSEMLVGKKKWTDLVASDDVPAVVNYHVMRAENPSSCLAPYECRARDKDGFIHSFIASLSPVLPSERSVLSLVDVTVMRKLEKREREYVRNQRFLASSAVRLTELPAVDTLFAQVGEDLHYLLPNSLVLALPFDEESHTFRISAVSGWKKQKLQRQEAVKKILEGTVLRISPLTRRKCLKSTVERTLVQIRNPASLTEGPLPASLKMLFDTCRPTCDLHVVGFPGEGELSGCALIVTPKGSPIRNISQVVKTYLGQASNAIRRRLAESGLAFTKGRLQYLLGNVPALVYAAEIQDDGSFVYTYMSDSLNQFLGYEGQNVLYDKQFWNKKIHPEDREEFLQGVLPALYEKGNIAAEYRMKQRSGLYLWVYDGMRLVRDSPGKPRSVVGCWIDITERKRMEDALMIKHGALESLQLPMMLTDMELRIAYLNTAALKMWGYESSEDVVGKMFNDFIGPSTRYKKIMARLTEDGEWRGEVRGTKKDEARFEAYMIIDRVRDNPELPCYVAALYDLGDKKQMERELKKLRGLLERKVTVR
ncbi:MAG: PAS domain S-box protein [Methanomicrobiales archaeon]|nr:PAS domain S-box protein [Methanomicrobiales archaeon]